MSQTQSDLEASPTSAVRLWQITLILVLVAGGIFAVVRTRPNNEISEPFIAAVNDQLLSRDQFEAEIALQELKYEITGRQQAVDKPALFNRIIGDMLLLQAAAENDIVASPAITDAEIDSILARFNLSREEMVVKLDDHDLSWATFENSVHDYMTINRFVDEQLLADTALSERKGNLDEWMAAQYQDADMRFDQDFLDSINVSSADLISPGLNG